MKKTNAKKMLLTTAVAMITVVFAFAAIGTSVSGPVYVNVDIKPSSCPNPVNVKSGGVLPVAVLGTDEFNVSDVNISTILLTREGYEGVVPIRCNYEDVATPFDGEDGEPCECHNLSGDGYIDLTLKFYTQELVEALGLSGEGGNMITLTITGNLTEEYDGTPFEGSDCISVLEKGKK